MTDQQASGAAGPGADPRRWRALGVCLVVGFMTLLDVSIVNVALPSISRGLGASSADLSWVVSGYALTFGLVLVPAGRIGDARGRRTVFMAGLAAFTLASAACGLAPTPMLLVIARLVQGAAAGFLTPQVTGLIQLLFRGPERGRAFGLFGVVVGISTAIGPLLGGLLIAAGGETSGWRWIFFVNVPIGIVALVGAYRLIPARPNETKQPLTWRTFDPVGVVLLGVAVVSLMLPLVQEQQWHGSGKWLLLLVAAVFAAAFWLWERYLTRTGRDPLVDLSLFRIRSYSSGCLIGMLYFGGFTTIFFTFTLLLQEGEHYSALEAGLATTPFAVGSAIAARVGGNLVGRLGRRLVVIGLMMVTVGLLVAILAVDLDSGRSVAFSTALPLLFAGFGSGLVISPNQTVTLSEVPVTRAGIAGAVQQTGQRIGTAAGIALVGAVFFARLSATGSESRAFIDATAITIALIVVALIVAAIDWAVTRRTGRQAGASESAPA